jgi:hypothetical protein
LKGLKGSIGSIGFKGSIGIKGSVSLVGSKVRILRIV